MSAAYETDSQDRAELPYGVVARAWAQVVAGEKPSALAPTVGVKPPRMSQSVKTASQGSWSPAMVRSLRLARAGDPKWSAIKRTVRQRAYRLAALDPRLWRQGARFEVDMGVHVAHQSGAVTVEPDWHDSFPLDIGRMVCERWSVLVDGDVIRAIDAIIDQTDTEEVADA